MRKKFIAVITVALAGITLAGCATRNVNIDEADATSVPGAKGLYRFCDQSTLIYSTSIQGSSDEYDAYFYGGCSWDEKSQTFLPAIGPEVEPRTDPSNPVTDEMNQQQDRDEE